MCGIITMLFYALQMCVDIACFASGADTFKHSIILFAGVAELADAIDLGSIGNTVQVQVLSPASKR